MTNRTSKDPTPCFDRPVLRWCSEHSKPRRVSPERTVRHQPRATPRAKRWVHRSQRVIKAGPYCFLVSALALILLSAAAAHAFSEPDAIYYGNVSIDGQAARTGVEVPARLDGDLLGSYRIGSNPAGGNFYVLRVPLVPAMPTARAPGAAQIGDMVNRVPQRLCGGQCPDRRSWHRASPGPGGEHRRFARAHRRCARYAYARWRSWQHAWRVPVPRAECHRASQHHSDCTRQPFPNPNHDAVANTDGGGRVRRRLRGNGYGERR
jgi:hypothetical protein